jgi:hypothetical protein
LNKPMLINKIQTPVAMLCRRKFVLEHFNQVPSFFRCYKCDICCDNEFTDITNIVLSYMFKFELSPEEEEVEPNIRQNLINYRLINCSNKNIYLTNGLENWVKYINMKYKGKKPDKLPLKLLITVPILETEDTDPIDKFVNMHKTNVKTNVKTSKYTKYVRKPNNNNIKPSIISVDDFMD